LTFKKLHGVISQKIKLFINTVVRTSNPTQEGKKINVVKEDKMAARRTAEAVVRMHHYSNSRVTLLFDVMVTIVTKLYRSFLGRNKVNFFNINAETRRALNSNT
jgi:hypothetical protein